MCYRGSQWLKKIDWTCGGPLDIEINFAPKKSTTPLVQRLMRQRRSIENKLNGRNRRDPVFLNKIYHVAVQDGETKNQQVRIMDL